ncbi:MAG: hypothetical protein CMP65_03210 [Flavobacteriales bacterium]|nr:hypothetical protein [Flavobacteriales bacterium]
MKQITTLFCVLAMLSFSFAQSSAKKQAKRSAMQGSIKAINSSVENRSADCIWESDFTNVQDWVIDHDSSDCSLDWEIGENLACEGFYPIESIVSSDGFYAMLDSDEYGGEEGGTETEDSWLTTATSIDCSQYTDVIVEFDTWYQSYNSEKCFLVVSTDGTFPTDLSPTTEADPSQGIYELFPDISGTVQANTGNPFTKRVNISEYAGGESQVWIRFNWTGTWGYAWFIDRVCITQQPANDIELSYGVVSHNGTNEEYGRVPTAQVNGEINYSAAVFNFGTDAQTGVDISLDILDGQMYPEASTMFGPDNTFGLDADGFVDFTQPAYGPLEGDDIYYFDMGVDASTMGPDKYTAMFIASSDEDMDGGEFFSDNTATREFEITTNEYSSDGLGMHSLASVGRIGSGSFTDAEDGLIVMGYYDISTPTEVVGARIILDSFDWGNSFTTPGTVEGGEIVLSLRDTTLISSETWPGASSVIAETDFIMVTADDVTNGYIDINFDSPVSVGTDAYFLGAELWSNGNEADIFILDDETIPQPFYLSMIYIPGDQAYSNGNSIGIRMITTDENIVSLEESVTGLSIYPNPSNGIINIELDKNNNYSVQITDIVGKVVIDDKISSNTSFDLKHLDAGVYFVNVSNNEISKTEKIVIEK